MNRKAYGYRFYPQNKDYIPHHYQTLDVTDTMYTIMSAGTVFWGGDTYYSSYSQTLQHTRLILDYVPNSGGQMLKLAWMHPGGICTPIIPIQLKHESI